MAKTTMQVHLDEEHEVQPFELFFDLVYVYAFTQVTAFMAHDLSWSQVGIGAMIMAMLWWSWTNFTWIGNSVNLQLGTPRLLMLGAMGAMLVCGLTIGDATGDSAMTFALAYGFARLTSAGLAIWASRNTGDADFHKLTRGFAAGGLVPPVLIVVGAALGGDWLLPLWGLAIAFDYASPYVLAEGDWHISGLHFAERHRLIIIIALGEAIISIGTGAEGLPIDAELIAAALFAFASIAMLWWVYFDYVTLAGAAYLASRPTIVRGKLARDAYSILHLPMVFGTVLFALGVKKAMAHLDEPMKTIPLAALFGGIIVFQLAQVAWRWRAVRVISRSRLMAMAAVAAIPLVFGGLDAIWILAVMAAATTVIAWQDTRGSKTMRQVAQREDLVDQLLAGRTFGELVAEHRAATVDATEAPAQT